MPVIEGQLDAGPDAELAIVVARFNDVVTRKLLSGALATLGEHGVSEDRVNVVWTPGAFEIPLAAARLAASGRYAAVICLGAVVQGETLHHEYINSEVSRALMQIGLETGIPVLFGVLTTRNMEQALERAGGKAGNKGSEAALAALEMIGLIQQLPPPHDSGS
ncbi:MAG: 6,7-dimethyl-8-ribityllumazine synthase [Planctomycetota bacterium]|nr:MAG: 6,7-dimethyl-8-ribityllumazine synthase [Planctomycetota bacterium]REK25635.1 MAG: 6,7-dimethyl-8-ribityllumazine synthase [Planctomycetota bacterium]REK31653.1 MAG: 6,7-dimethyl-8-ribityllumazine synthase [Planctomycetota bacterium]